MAKEHSYGITLKNNLTEQEAIAYLLAQDFRFINPVREKRKKLMELKKIPKTFSRAWDLIYLPDIKDKFEYVEITEDTNVIFIEIKSTRKALVNNPYGFFFGATDNEFKLAEILGDKYEFCFICLAQGFNSYVRLSLNQLKELIVTQRIQYQINLVNKK